MTSPSPSDSRPEPESAPDNFKGSRRARPDSRFHRTIRWLTSANTYVLTALSLITALIVGAILIVLSNRAVMSQFGYFFADPGAALSGAWAAITSAYSNLFEGAIFDPSTLSGALNGTNSWSSALFPISETLTYAAPLIFTGLAVTVAFRAGLFNIGAQGQAIFGAIGAGLIGFELHLPIVLHLILALIGGIVGGALAGGFVGFLKARTGAHEVIVTIMLNYIALYFLSWLITQKGVQDPTRTDAISKTVRSSATLPTILGANLRTNLGLILGLAAVVGIGWLLSRSTFGFELRAVGANPNAARTAGMSVGRTYTVAMMIAGGLAGLGGATILLGTAHQLTGAVVGNIGFDGITVALLGRGKPWGVVWAALLFGAFSAGGNRLQSYTGVTVDFVNVLQAVIVIFVAAPKLIESIYHLRPDKSAETSTNLAKGW